MGTYSFGAFPSWLSITPTQGEQVEDEDRYPRTDDEPNHREEQFRIDHDLLPENQPSALLLSYTPFLTRILTFYYKGGDVTDIEVRIGQVGCTGASSKATMANRTQRIGRN